MTVFTPDFDTGMQFGTRRGALQVRCDMAIDAMHSPFPVNIREEKLVLGAVENRCDGASILKRRTGPGRSSKHSFKLVTNTVYVVAVFALNARYGGGELVQYGIAARILQAS